LLRVILTDLPSPAEAGFAKAGNRVAQTVSRKPFAHVSGQRDFYERRSAL